MPLVLKEIEKQILGDPILDKLTSLAKEKGFHLFLVGGYIRDLLLGTHRSDYDFALPREASSSIPMLEETLGFHFFKLGGEETETIAYRMVKGDLSIDLTIFTGKTIHEDLLRRDFTINAIAFNLWDKRFYQVEGAIEDIENKVIRAVSKRSIDQDPLRMLRAIRYLCKLEDFVIDPALRAEILAKGEQIGKLPGERIKMELDQILLSPRPAQGIRLLYELGLLPTLLPEMEGLEDLGQNGHHHLPVLAHTLLMVEKISWAAQWVRLQKGESHLSREDWLCLFYATLLHDIGKQETDFKDGAGRVHFYHHESSSCRIAEGVMERLRFSNRMKKRILHIIKHHMRILSLQRNTKEAALRRVIHLMGDETLLLVLHTLADKEASRGILSQKKDKIVEDHCLQVMDLLEKKEIVHPPLLITGHDVMDLGYRPGPKVGQILEFIRRKQVEGTLKSREEALRVLKERFSSGPEVPRM